MKGMLQTENDQVKAHLYKMKGSTSSVEGGSDFLHDEIQASGQSGSTNGGSSSVGKANAPLHGEIQTSGYGGGTSEGGSSVGNIGTPVHEEIQTSGYGGSKSNIAQVVRDNVKESVGKVKERIDHSQTIPKTKRSYQIGRNTGLDLRNLGSKKRNKPEEK
ncbi:hypothetical protein ASE46_24740 [Bacillus sp. Root239]|nr:hypothetical protein ASE46_24740 [Bacillus sp. Root239]